MPRSVIGLIGRVVVWAFQGLIPANDGWVALGTEGGHSSFAPDERGWRSCATPGANTSTSRLSDWPPAPVLPLSTWRWRTMSARRSRHGCPKSPGAPWMGTMHCAKERSIRSAPSWVPGLAATRNRGFGGIYIGGASCRAWALFDTSPFRAQFEDKGRFADYNQRIPTFVITAEDAHLACASAILCAQLRTLETRGGFCHSGADQAHLAQSFTGGTAV